MSFKFNTNLFRFCDVGEDDRFLLECNFDKLATTNGKQQEYWILAIQAAKEACCLRAMARDTTQCCGHGTAEG